jgi:amino acid adenylation domain-containing protein
VTTSSDTIVVETSYAQQSLWLLDQIDPGQATYNVIAAVRLRGALDVAALQRSLNAVVARHEALRTVFDFDGHEPVQVIRATATLDLPVTDATAGNVDDLVNAEVERPFDLREGPLLRVRLLRVADEEHVAVLVMHHIITDGFSSAILLRELGTCYAAYAAGRRPRLPELRLQYADYAVWQRDTLRDQALADEVGYWREQLAGISPLLLPTDRARPAVPTARGATYTFDLPADQMRQLEKMASDWDVTPFMLILAVFSVLLARYSARTDFTVAAPVAGRDRSELAGIIGFFINTLVLRMDLRADPTFGQLLSRVRQACLSGYAHMQVPYEKLVEELRPARYNGNGGPLAQVMFSLMNVPMGEWEAGGLTFEPMTVTSGTAKFDLSLDISPRGAGYLASLEYSTELFEHSTIERMAGHLRTLLDAVVTDADMRVHELPLLTAGELTAPRSGPAPRRAPGECVHRSIERQAAATPHAPAVSCGPRLLSYASLDRQANGLAHQLRARGVAFETPVAICLPRCPELIVAYLAVLKAGGAYLPIDPDYPAERIAHMLADSGARHAITTTGLSPRLGGSLAEVVTVDPLAGELPSADEPPPGQVHPNQLAYIVYTSGTTGRPKGAMNTHAGLSAFAHAMAGSLGLSPADRALQLAPLGFDVVAEEVYPYLFTGGSVALPDGDAPLTAGELWDLVAATGATTFSTTPTRLLSWGEAGPAAPPAGLRRLIFGSEAAPALRSLRAWQAWPGQLLQVYGVTEACCTSSVRAVDFGGDPDLIVPLGPATSAAELRVLDEWLRPVPLGVPGGLYIGGPAVGRGYVGKPGLTAERFPPDPYGPAGSRLYKTGDTVRQLASGDLQFVGRSDDQVKIRGFRVEPAEVEAITGEHPDVSACAISARPGPAGDLRLVGYVVPRAGAAISPAALRGFLAARMPDWMVPSAFVLLPELPVGANGKVDRSALPEPDGPSGDEHYTPPRTPIEEELAGIWSEVLGHDRVSVEAGFFDLGGNSLAAVRLIAEIRERLGVDLPVRALFSSEPTIAAIGEQVFALLLADEEMEAS